MQWSRDIFTPEFNAHVAGTFWGCLVLSLVLFTLDLILISLTLDVAPASAPASAPVARDPVASLFALSASSGALIEAAPAIGDEHAVELLGPCARVHLLGAPGSDEPRECR